jgi:hypothetical protein
MMTILILFRNSRVKTFKDFFIRILCRYHRSDFPRWLTYDRFVALIPRCVVPMIALFLATTGKCTGISFMDSTRLKICDNHIIHKHRTFRGITKREKSSMGWFFGFKLHAVINHLGDIIDVSITSGDTKRKYKMTVNRAKSKSFWETHDNWLTPSLFRCLLPSSICNEPWLSRTFYQRFWYIYSPDTHSWQPKDVQPVETLVNMGKKMKMDSLLRHNIEKCALRNH